jgi:hypothetical protein
MHNQNLNQSGLDAWREKAASVNEIKRISAPVDDSPTGAETQSGLAV